MNGFATKLDAKRWRVRWRDPAGKNRSRTFENRQDALRFLTEVRRATALSLPVEPEALERNHTLESFAADWWARKRPTLRARTAVVYETALSLHLPRAMLLADLRSIKPRQVEELLATLPTPTARKVRTVLFQVYNDAIRFELCDRNPVLNARVLNGAEAPLRPEALPSPEEVEKIALQVPERYRALVLVAAFAGLRLGEASGLRPSDIDVHGHTIRVERQWNQVARAMTAPKTRSGNRTTVFAERITEALAFHLERYGTDALVFTNGAGSPIHPTNFRTRVWQPATEALGLGGLHFHSLRHIYASLLIGGGVNLALVARLMGHSNPQVTLTVYSHFFDSDFSKAHHVLGGGSQEPPKACAAAIP